MFTSSPIQVEAVLEDFEKRNANNEDKSAVCRLICNIYINTYSPTRIQVEAQRIYLGGDGDHSILVKGLDFALLEQNKAREAALNIPDDDSLEQTFLEVSSSHFTVPKKRTREDLIRELKEKRRANGATATDIKQPSQHSAEEEVRLLEEAKKSGKFKPIGFKPIGTPQDTGKKKVKGDVKDREKKKKRRKVVDSADPVEEKIVDNEIPPHAVPTPSQAVPHTLTEPDSEVLPDDFDIFAGAGDYEGVDLGDDDDEEGVVDTRATTAEEDHLTLSVPPRRWIESDEPASVPQNPAPNLLSSILRPASPPPLQPPEKKHGHEAGDPEEEEQVQQPIRLQPLESSALPSIKDFLAMEDAASGSGKWKNKKSRKKGAGDGDGNDSKKRNAEAKADRDYKRFVFSTTHLRSSYSYGFVLD